MEKEMYPIGTWIIIIVLSLHHQPPVTPVGVIPVNREIELGFGVFNLRLGIMRDISVTVCTI